MICESNNNSYHDDTSAFFQFFFEKDPHLNAVECTYFGVISVASSLQVTLQLYFQIFYSTALNKIFIKLTKLKRQTAKLKHLKDIKQLVIKNRFSGKNHRSILL